MTPENIEALITAHIPDANVSVTSGDNVHFDAVVVAESFASLNIVKRQQLVYQALGNNITDGTIHALSLKTLTPGEQG